MAYTKAQLEAIKNTLLASNQPILANQHREQIQSMIDEMYDAQSRADILVGVQADSITGGSDTFIVFRNGEAYQIPLSLLSANSLANLGDVFISNLEDGNTLVYNAVAERWENQNIFLGFAISNLDDVQLTSLANGDILRYNSTSEKWENTSLATILSPYALLTDLNDYQLLSEKGQANGYAQLDTGAKLPISIIPDSVLGQVEYQGTWNASTNTPTLPSTPLKKGDYYVVSADGTQFGIDFLVGDWIISNGTIWEKVDNTDAVTSVFGRLGNIVANASDYSAFYVTLDTAQTITANKTFTQRILIAPSTDNFSYLGFKQASGGSVGQNGFTSIYASGSNQISFRFNQSAGVNRTFSFSSLAITDDLNRVYTMPNANGTIALTSDIHNPVTLGTANGLSLTGQELSLGLASTSTNGALSSTDWNTFNTKIGGTLATGQVAFGTAANTVGGDNGFLFNATTKVLTTTADAVVNGVNIGKGGGNISNNLRVGAGALAANLVGVQNIAIGSSALANNTSSDNIAIGVFSLFANTTGTNISIGNFAMITNTTGTSNIAIGNRAMMNSSTSNNNLAIGIDALRENNGTQNVALGSNALRNNNSGIQNIAIGSSSLTSSTTGTNNTAVGDNSAGSNTTGGNNSVLGRAALFGNTTGSNNVVLGSEAARRIADGTTVLTISNNSIFIGVDTRAADNSQTNQIVIGHNAIGIGSNSVVLGNSSILTTVLRGNVLVNTTTDAGFRLDVNGTARVQGDATITGNLGIGTTSPEFKLDVNGTIRSSGANPSFRTDNTSSYTSLVSHLGGTRSWQIDNINNHFNLFIAGTTNSYIFNVTSTGNVGIGTDSPATSAILDLTSTTGALLLPRMTTTQRDALTAVNGMILYNTTTNTTEARQDGAWVDLSFVVV